MRAAATEPHVDFPHPRRCSAASPKFEAEHGQNPHVVEAMAANQGVMDD